MLDNLVKFIIYDIRIMVFNFIGDGLYSTFYFIYVGDVGNLLFIKFLFLFV